MYAHNNISSDTLVRIMNFVFYFQDYLYARSNKNNCYSTSSPKSLTRPPSQLKQFDNSNNTRALSLNKSQSGIFLQESSKNAGNVSMPNRKQKMQNGYISFVSGHNDFRSRKLGVINAACSRMLNNLIGRASMPPDLPTNISCSPLNNMIESSNVPSFSFPVTGTSQTPELHETFTTSVSTPSSPTGLNPKLDNFSFRKVFKKRSVQSYSLTIEPMN